MKGFLLLSSRFIAKSNYFLLERFTIVSKRNQYVLVSVLIASSQYLFFFFFSCRVLFIIWLFLFHLFLISVSLICKNKVRAQILFSSVSRKTKNFKELTFHGVKKSLPVNSASSSISNPSSFSRSCICVFSFLSSARFLAISAASVSFNRMSLAPVCEENHFPCC